MHRFLLFTADFKMPPSKKRFSFGRRWAHWLLLLPFAVGILMYALIVLVDPYALRGGFISQHLGTHRYPDREWPLLMNVATAEPHDFVLIGGSTTMAITPEMIRQSFPEMHSPLNLSYIAPRPLDMGEALERIQNVKNLKRVVVVMDFSLMENRPYRSAAGETWENMAKTSWHHGGDFSFATGIGSLKRVLFGTYTTPAWGVITKPQFMDGAAPVSKDAKKMLRFREAVKMHADDVFAKSELGCTDIPFLDNQLQRFLTQAKNKDIDVDLVFPPVPYILAYDWIDNRPRFGILKPGPVFDQFMTFKRCTVALKERSGGGGVRVLALDGNDEISANIDLYVDSAHIFDEATYQAVTKMIAEGEATITTENIDYYETGMKQRIVLSGQKILKQN
jgi:hypothetical protein